MKQIPIIDITDKAISDMITMLPDETQDLFAHAQARYSKLGMTIGDKVSWNWLKKTNNPYIDEIKQTSDVLGVDGAALLNISYEWACTTGISRVNGVPRMIRVLDWDLPGLGRNLVVAKQRGNAGDYYNITWPGFSGVITAYAPGRFAIAINQPPLPSDAYRPTKDAKMLKDWWDAKKLTWAAEGLPPAHLLRKVFDECADYNEAVEMLNTYPITTPTFYSVCGVDDYTILERTRTDCMVRDSEKDACAVANHWLSHDLKGVPRGHDSTRREAVMYEKLKQDIVDNSWADYPILNPDTRLIMNAIPNEKSPRLIVQGYEEHGVATELLQVF